ncbi:MAG: DUF3050 domain-containing protein [Thioalkalispiraceae bacterium]|jgi:hypothetical protein
MSLITEQVIAGFKNRLEQHPVYQAVNSIERLGCFMEHHVYSVWDFMSLIKYLQNEVAPTRYPWIPEGDPDVRRFINELVLEEESDQIAPGSSSEHEFTSHFELYCGAMNEIGASPDNILAFVEQVKCKGIDTALDDKTVPGPSRKFTRQTFEFIASDKPHRVAAALALGREHIIPCMFRSFLKNLGVTEQAAPVFHYYLNRHVHLDEDFHAPLSLRLLNSLCEDDKQKQAEAIEAAELAVEARVRFWDGVLAAMDSI